MCARMCALAGSVGKRLQWHTCTSAAILPQSAAHTGAPIHTHTHTHASDVCASVERMPWSGLPSFMKMHWKFVIKWIITAFIWAVFPVSKMWVVILRQKQIGSSSLEMWAAYSARWVSLKLHAPQYLRLFIIMLSLFLCSFIFCACGTCNDLPLCVTHCEPHSCIHTYMLYMLVYP